MQLCRLSIEEAQPLEFGTSQMESIDIRGDSPGPDLLVLTRTLASVPQSAVG